MTDRVSIAVVDDHPIFRTGVIRILKDEPNFVVVAEGTSAKDAVRIATTVKPDVMILDVSMPGDGLVAARTITDTMSGIKIVFLTMIDDDSFVTSALKAGARGYVLKGISAPELIRTIWTMQKGEGYISPDIAARMLAAMNEKNLAQPAGQAGPSMPELSGPDRQILAMVIEGRSYQQIAQRLGLDVQAVRSRLSSAVLLLHTSALDGDRSSPDAMHDKKRSLH